MFRTEMSKEGDFLGDLSHEALQPGASSSVLVHERAPVPNGNRGRLIG